MNTRLPPRPKLRKALPRIVFALAMAVATEPVWSIPLLGFSPTLDQLLLIRCLAHP